MNAGCAQSTVKAPTCITNVCLELPAFDKLNCIDNVASTPTKTFKALLDGLPTTVLAIEDDAKGDDVIDDLVPFRPPHVQPPVPAAPRAGPGAGRTAFVFHCRTASGEKPLTIHLDGWSHQSGRRRVDAQCVHDGHTRCHHYKFIHLFDVPLKSIAYVLCYIRGGHAADNKLDHFRLLPPSEHDLLAVWSEVEPHAALIVA